MFPRYKLVVDGSPTSWEPGAQSSKTADTEKRKEFPAAVWQDQHYFLSKMKVFTVTILSRNYHWTDGFFVKNHPLKEAEKQYKFCFRVDVDKGTEGGVRQERALSGQVSARKAVTWLKQHLQERLPSVPESGSKRLTRPFILCLSSLSSCILQDTDTYHSWLKSVFNILQL